MALHGDLAWWPGMAAWHGGLWLVMLAWQAELLGLVQLGGARPVRALEIDKLIFARWEISMSRVRCLFPGLAAQTSMSSRANLVQARPGPLRGRPAGPPCQPG